MNGSIHFFFQMLVMGKSQQKHCSTTSLDLHPLRSMSSSIRRHWERHVMVSLAMDVAGNVNNTAKDVKLEAISH